MTPRRSIQAIIHIANRMEFCQSVRTGGVWTGRKQWGQVTTLSRAEGGAHMDLLQRLQYNWVKSVSGGMTGSMWLFIKSALALQSSDCEGLSAGFA
ncbi:MAG: hypothetical protein DRP66_03975 [Planctomycetota bacterium]|nr:MAG: hypothetical protein DRP66_03975 [Planctomycetota bacterium]